MYCIATVPYPVRLHHPASTISACLHLLDFRLSTLRARTQLRGQADSQCLSSAIIVAVAFVAEGLRGRLVMQAYAMPPP